MSEGPKWPAAMAAARDVTRLWLFVWLPLSAVRLLFVLRFADEAGSTAAAFLHGARFDARIATFFALPSLLMALGGLAATSEGAVGLSARASELSRRARDVTAYLYCALTPLLSAVALDYYAEFNSPFGPPLFDFFYDDTLAVIGALLRDYGLAWKLVVCAALSAVGVLGWRRVRDLELGTNLVRWMGGLRRSGRVLSTIVLVALLIGAWRGSFGGRPAIRKWSAITGSAVLDDAVLNPWSHVIYAVRDHRRLGRGERLESFLPDRDVAAAAARYFGNQIDTSFDKSVFERVGTAVSSDLDGADFLDPRAKTTDEWMAQVARGPKTEPPRHVFVIVMESLDAWTLEDAYAPLHLNDELRALRDAGIGWDRFLPGSDTTIKSLATILLGLPDPGVFTARQRTASTTYKTSWPATMKQLGYRTRLFYGGMLSWQRLGAFSRAQGFDEVYGRGEIANDESAGWGLHDGPLYTFAAEHVSDDTPSFNLILTLSFHPPYDLDLEAAGFPLDSLSDDALGDVPYDASERLGLRQLGHLWYADQQMGLFVRRMQQTHPDALFVITGDHHSRRPARTDATFYDISAVPLVMVGSQVLRDLQRPTIGVGSHIDLMPTVVELSAPRGFRYWAAGEDLFADRRRPWALGAQRAIGVDYLVDLSVRPAKVHPVPGVQPPSRLPTPRIRRDYDDLQGIAWWRIVRGPAVR